MSFFIEVNDDSNEESKEIDVEYIQNQEFD